MANKHKLTIITVLVIACISSNTFAMSRTLHIERLSLPSDKQAELRLPSEQDSYLVAYKQLAKLLGSSLYQRMLENDSFLKIQEIALGLLANKATRRSSQTRLSGCCNAAQT